MTKKKFECFESKYNSIYIFFLDFEKMFLKKKLENFISNISRNVLRIAVVFILFRKSSQHGYLQEPPARNCAWRYGFNTPPNYDDNGLNCGGFATQWFANGMLPST
jgi:hypothetical protein